MIYISKVNGQINFYMKGMQNIPSDAFEISRPQYLALLAAQNQRKTIDITDGQIIVTDHISTPDEIAAIAKIQKNIALAQITVVTSSGKVFDGNETARINMLSAITAANTIGQSSANWKLADNTVANVTLDEIKEALALAILRVGEIVTATN